MEKFILGFDEIKKNDVAAAGGKGANLGEMTGAGIPVPSGAVLSAQAYDCFMDHNGIDAQSLAEISAETVRNAISSGVLPEELRSQILEFYHSLGNNARVAVRSSATAEDLADASFAGQQETYLNVCGDDELLEKVRECYCSLWGDRAVSYRKTQGYDKQKVSLAVVIQEMVESECAGVIFTKDPSGLSDDIVINASYGLGEAVVSGIVSPDEYRCGRDGGIRRVVTGSKEIQIVYDGKGTKKEAVPEEKRISRVLTDSEAAELVKQALVIEKHYGAPMDIEWAMRNGTVYILQARNITSLGGSSDKIFTDADFEGLPVVKPAKGRFRENILFNLEKLPKPYYPLDSDFGDAVGKQKNVLFAEAGIGMGDTCPINRDGISTFALGGIKPNKNVLSLPKYFFSMKNDDTNIQISDSKIKEFKTRLREEKSLDCKSAADAGQSLERMQKLISDTAYTRFRYAIFPQVLENIGLSRTLKKADKEYSSFDLMEGLSYVTADINREMADIAGYIRDDEKKRSDVMEMDYASVIRKYPDLKERFTSFMAKYGNRSSFNCYCFMSQSWNDDPDRFLGTLRTMVRSNDAKFLTKEEGRAKFMSIMEHVKNSVGADEYKKFKKKVNAVRHYHYVREYTQYLWESEFAHCRSLLRKCSGFLDTDYNDLMYLFADELFEVCRDGKVDERYTALIAHRKEKRPLAEAYWDKCIENALASDSSDVAGVSGSSGKATGKVCIVNDTSEFGKLQQGEVLVCPYTDPEWTPLFTLASAVVVDTGGTLSHAAIVAREYKIPAVLATGNATKVFKDGELIMVDGSNGIVRAVR